MATSRAVRAIGGEIKNVGFLYFTEPDSSDSNKYVIGGVYYIRLGHLLDWIRDNIIPSIRDKNGTTLNGKIIKINTDPKTNIIHLEQRQIITDPRICVFKTTIVNPLFGLNIDSFSSTSQSSINPINIASTVSTIYNNALIQGASKIEFSAPICSDFEEGEFIENNNRYLYLMNTYFSMSWILNKMNSMVDSEGNIVLLDFLQSLCDGFSEATLHDFYTGIDFKLIEKGDQMKYEFHVKPMSQIKQIQLEYFGQKNIFIDRKGNLLIETSLGRIIEEKPYSYQVINGKIIEIPTEFILSDNLVSFKVSNYNEEYELIIDPILVFATYSGSKTDNFGMTATYASDGKVYSGGTIYGNAYPTPENTAYDISSNFTVVNNGNLNYGITDVFISKYSSDGSKMIWTNFIGGGNDKQGTETVHSLIADKSDNIYLFGATSSIDFPIFNGYQKKHAGGKTGLNFTANGVFHLDQGTDIYVTKISSNGQDLLGSTYIGGAGNDGPNYNTNYFVNPNVNNGYDSLLYNYGDNSRGEIILDTSGNCIIASCTHSTNFPVKNYFQKNWAPSPLNQWHC